MNGTFSFYNNIAMTEPRPYGYVPWKLKIAKARDSLDGCVRSWLDARETLLVQPWRVLRED